MRVGFFMVLALGASLLPLTGPSALTPLEDKLADIDRCVRSNADSESMRQIIELDTFDRADSKRSLAVTLLRKRFDTELSRVVMRVTAPLDMRNTAFLLIEQDDRPNDIFSYMPSLDRVRRISIQGAAGSLFGSDFSYEDMERIHTVIESGQRQLLPDGTIKGRNAYVVESTNEPGTGSSYERIVSYIDKERCGLLQVEMFEAGDVLRKLLTIDPASVVQIEEHWIAKRVSIEDRRQRTHSVMTIHEIELDIEIANSAFSTSALTRRH